MKKHTNKDNSITSNISLHAILWLTLVSQSKYLKHTYTDSSRYSVPRLFHEAPFLHLQ